MSERRQSIEIWTLRLPQNRGKKPGVFSTTKIELFPSHYWAEHWEPGSKLFSPRLPLRSISRKEYWETRYRVRVDGRWLGTKAKYVTYTRDEVIEKYFK
jgi:hypothetical protein